jgi:hypothetical protein
MHKKEANKSILKVGFIVIGVIVLFAVLFSVSPRDKAVAGQAILLSDNTNVFGYSPTSTRNDDFNVRSIVPGANPTVTAGGGAILSVSTVDYTILGSGANDPATPPGTYACPPGQGFSLVTGGSYPNRGCFFNQNVQMYADAWVLLDIGTVRENVNRIRVVGKNQQDGCNPSNPACNPTTILPDTDNGGTSYHLFITNRLNGADTLWTPLQIGGSYNANLPITTAAESPQTHEFDANNAAVDGVLIVRSGRGPAAPDPRIYSVELVEGCSVNGAVDSANDRICENNLWKVGLSCSTVGVIHPENRAYCKEESLGVLKWSSMGDLITTRYLYGDRTVLPGTVSGFCGNENFCVGSNIQGNLICSADGSITQIPITNAGTTTLTSFACSNKKFYFCSVEARDRGGIIDDRFVCLGTGTSMAWQDGLDCPTEGLVNGQAICRSGTVTVGRRTVTQLRWTDCNSLDETVCIANRAEVCNAQTENRRSTDNQYYCSSGRWTLCNAERLGEGVDNGVNPTNYQDTYVCSTSTAGNVVTYSWQPTTCGPPGRPSTAPGPSCAGEGPGDCIGSSIVNASDGQVLGSIIAPTGHYAYNYNIRFLGCSTSDGCYYDDGDLQTNDFYPVDGITPNLNLDLNGDTDFTDPGEGSGIQLVCGRSNTWLRCLTQTGFIPSDGGRYMCDSSITLPGWVECDEINSGDIRGNFECVQVLGRWQWFNQFACSPGSRYVVRGSETDNPEICDGDGANSKFVGCSEIDDTFNDPTASVYNANVLVSCANLGNGRTIYANETGALACFNTGVDADDDRDGAANCDDSDCNSVNVYSVTSLFTSKGRNNTMVRLQANSCGAVNLNQPSNPDFTNLRLCDTGTTSLSTHATICYDNNQQVQVPSVEFLSRDVQSTMLTVNGLTFVYFEPTNTNFKMVDVFNASLDLLDYEVNYSVSEIAPSLVSGQNLLLKVGINFYLLTYPSTQSLFNVANVVIKDLSRRTDHVAQNYVGTNDYVFDIEGDNQIVVGIVDGVVRFRSQPTAEILAGRPTTRGINRNFEVQFTKKAPVYVTERLSVFSVCRQDVDAILEEAILCINNTQIANLRNNYLTELRPFAVDRLNPNNPANNMKYAFLFTHNGTDKVISMFNITDLDEADIENGLTDGYSDEKFTYVNYVNSLIAGRRVAIKFGGKLYLANHPVRNTFSQKDVVFKSYVNGQVTDFPGSGNDALVEYSLFDGQVSVARSFGYVPPLPFDVNGISTEALLQRPFNLREDSFSTVMSSAQRVGISAPLNYGIISVATDDVSRAEDLFRLTSSERRTENIELVLGGTYESDVADPGNGFRSSKILFHYNSVRPIGTAASPAVLKSAAIYLLYELTSDGTSHPISDRFIDVFTRGKEIALQYGTNQGNYYLLSYEGPNDQTEQGFTVRNLRLRSLLGGSNVLPEVNGLTARFSVPDGRISVTADYNRVSGDRLVFNILSNEQLLTVNLNSNDYMIPINTTHRVEISNPTNPAQSYVLELCNQNVNGRQNLDEANVCYGESGITNSIIVERPQLLNLDINRNGQFDEGEFFVLEINGRTQESKAVFMRRIFNLTALDNNYAPDRWSRFAGNVSSGFGPVFNINSSLYVPLISGIDLSTFAFAKFPDAALVDTYRIKLPLSRFTSITAGGNVTVDSDIVNIRQSLNSDAVRDQYVIANFDFISAYSYLPDNGRELLFNFSNPVTPTSNVRFVSTLNTNVYTLSVTPQVTGRSTTLRLTLQDENGVIYLRRNFAEGDSRRLFLDNAFVDIRVKNIVYNLLPGCMTNPATCQFVHADITVKRGS